MENREASSIYLTPYGTEHAPNQTCTIHRLASLPILLACVFVSLLDLYPAVLFVVEAAESLQVRSSRRVESIEFSLKGPAEVDTPRFRGSTGHGRYPLRLCHDHQRENVMAFLRRTQETGRAEDPGMADLRKHIFMQANRPLEISVVSRSHPQWGLIPGFLLHVRALPFAICHLGGACPVQAVKDGEV